MALATQCPHCGTMFKVAADQLKLRGGIVRCGKCSEMFDGNAALVDPAASPAPASEATELAPTPGSEDETPVYTLDFDTTFEPLGIIPKPGLPEPEPEAESSESEPAPQLDIDFDHDLLVPPPVEPTIAAAPELDVVPEESADTEAVQLVVPDDGAVDAPEQADASDGDEEVVDSADHAEPVPADHEASVESQDPAVEDEVQDAELIPAVVPSEPVHAQEPAPADDIDEPEFVTSVRKKDQARRITRILMALGSVLLLAGLLAQGVSSFASVLAARYPQAKPALTEACKLLRCQVALPAQIEMLSIETGELQTIAENTFMFSTVLRNDSTLLQTWPHIELALTNVGDKPLVRRVITPAEYLLHAAITRGFAAKTEQPVKIYFQLDGVAASGYHVAIFHP